MALGYCWECEKKSEIHWHHVVPRSFGGTRVLPLCEGCHGKVHGRDMRISELVKAGQQRARELGKRIGRPVHAKYNEIVEMKLAGHTEKEITAALGAGGTTIDKIWKRYREGRFKPQASGATEASGIITGGEEARPS